MSSFRVGWAITLRFLRQQFRNRSAIVVTFAVPLLLAGVLGYADQRANTAVPIGLYNASRTSYSDHLAATIKHGRAVRVDTYSSLDSLEHAIRRGDIAAGVVIPAGYDRQIRQGGEAAVEVHGKSHESGFLAARADVLLSVLHENVALNTARHDTKGNNADLLAAMPPRTAEAPIPVERVTASGGTHAVGLGRFTAGMLVFFIFDTAMFDAAVFRDDRRRGVLARLSTTPNHTAVIAAGEIAGRALIAAVQGLTLVVAGRLLFDLHWGDPIGVAAIIVFFTLAATGAGLLVGVSGRGKTVAETETSTAGLIAVVGLIGGCFWSLSIIPGWLRNVAHVSPHAWANDGFDKLLATNAGLPQLWLPLLVLGAFAAVLFALAVRSFRTSMRR